MGGYLRDSLLSLPAPDEVDIAAPGDPQSTGRDLALALDGTYVPLGPAHGVSRVLAVADEGRRWTIDIKGYSGTIQDDLASRDFTIDAMALHLDHWDSAIRGEMVEDPFNGRQDLAGRRIRALNDQIFRHDPGRLLRAVRLAARLQFMMDPDTARLVRADSHRISQVSGERVRDEFLALLRLDRARGHLEVLDRLDLLCRIIPELALTKGVEQPKVHYWDVWGHSLHAVETAELVTKGHQNSPNIYPSPLEPGIPRIFQSRGQRRSHPPHHSKIGGSISRHREAPDQEKGRYGSYPLPGPPGAGRYNGGHTVGPDAN